MTDKIIRVIVKGSGTNVTIQNLLNIQLLNSEYTQAYLCIDKFIGYQNGINNSALYLHVSSIDECYINNTTLLASPAQICNFIDIFDGNINNAGTGVKYLCFNNVDTWLPIKMDQLNNLTFTCYGIMNQVNVLDLNFIMTIKIKFVK